MTPASWWPLLVAETVEEDLAVAETVEEVSAAAETVSCGAAIDCKDKSGMRPLLYAALYGRPELVHMLLNAGATKQGLALLNAASGGTPGNTAVAKQLLCYEKKLKRCHGGGSVLDYALFLAAREGHLEMATLLLDAGADVDVFQSPDDDPEFGG